MIMPMKQGIQGANDCAIVSIANYFGVDYARVMSEARKHDATTCQGKRGTPGATILHLVRLFRTEKGLPIDNVRWIKWQPRPNRSSLATLKLNVFTKSGLLWTYKGKLSHCQMVIDSQIIGTTGQVETVQDIRMRGWHFRAFVEC
jgi:hypothetical protein